MVLAWVAERLSHPIWIDRCGKECSNNDALGCMVIHKLCPSDRCFVGDLVGRNVSMKGDGHAGGKLLLRGQGQVHTRSSHVEKRFTMIGLTALDGAPILCVLIFPGAKRDLLLETGIYIRAKS